MQHFTAPQWQALLLALGASVADVVFFKAPDGTYLYVNRAFEHLYGYTLDQLVGHTDFDFLTEDEAAFFAARDQEALAAGVPTRSQAWQLNELTGQRECYETVKTPVQGPDGELLGLLGVSHNVTACADRE